MAGLVDVIEFQKVGFGSRKGKLRDHELAKFIWIVGEPCVIPGMGDGIGDKVLKTNLLDNVKGNDARSLKSILISPAAPIILRIILSSWLRLVLNQNVAGGIVQVEGNAGPDNVTGMHVEPRIPHGKVGRRVHVLRLLAGGTGIATGPIVRCPHVKVGIVLLHVIPQGRKVGPFSQHSCGRR